MLEVCKRDILNPHDLIGAGLRRALIPVEVGWIMDKSARYREYAAQCRGIAHLIGTGVLRSQLLNIAAEWEILAEDAARRSSQYTDTHLPKGSPRRL